MPAFESFIVGAPAGFNQSCNDLNKLAIVDPQLLATIVKKSLVNVNYVPSDQQELKYQNEIKTVNFIIRSFKAANPAPTFPQMASALDLNSLLTRDCVEKIIVAIQENSENQNQNAPLLSQVCIYFSARARSLVGSIPYPISISFLFTTSDVWQNAQFKVARRCGHELKQVQKFGRTVCVTDF